MKPRALIAEFAALALKTQTKAAQHLETCARCRRLFVSALQVADDEAVLPLADGAFGLTAKIIRELRTCPEWPPGA